MTGVTAVITDERTITVPVPAGPADTAKFVTFLSEAAAGGYTVKYANTLERGQRDPEVYGFRIVMVRST